MSNSTNDPRPNEPRPDAAAFASLQQDDQHQEQADEDVDGVEQGHHDVAGAS